MFAWLMKKLDWQWDRTASTEIPISLVLTRWRRGPITFYRRVVHQASINLTYTEYRLCFLNNISFCIEVDPK
jgi:hypothetical protein